MWVCLDVGVCKGCCTGLLALLGCVVSASSRVVVLSFVTCRNVAGERIQHTPGFLAVTFIKNAVHGRSIHCYICSCNFEGS